eukprot:1001389-Prymnesium_polylepis.1
MCGALGHSASGDSTHVRRLAVVRLRILALDGSLRPLFPVHLLFLLALRLCRLVLAPSFLAGLLGRRLLVCCRLLL